MKIAYPSGTTPLWVDRYTGRLYCAYDATGIAPHAYTLRSSTTVSGSQIGLLQYLSICVYRVSVPSTQGHVSVVMAIHDGSVEKNYVTMRRNITSAGEGYEYSVPLQIIIKSTDTLKIYTQDASVGGTCDYKTYIAGVILSG